MHDYVSVCACARLTSCTNSGADEGEQKIRKRKTGKLLTSVDGVQGMNDDDCGTPVCGAGSTLAARTTGAHGDITGALQRQTTTARPAVTGNKHFVKCKTPYTIPLTSHTFASKIY